MQGELSVLSYLQSKRLTHLAFKTWFTRRQRISTNHFRRYSVRTAEIDQNLKEKKNKVFDTDRVVTESNLDADELDRRIVFEMVGDRPDEAEFLDETSESEANEIDDDVVLDRDKESDQLGQDDSKQEALLSIQSDRFDSIDSKVGNEDQF